MMKILVTYATRTGSTIGVAEAIAKTLREHDFEADVFPMQEVTDLASYRQCYPKSAMVAGSSPVCTSTPG